jgi:hypothetical protein
MKQIFKGWAIDLKYDYPALAGVLFWGEPPIHCAAVRTAIFRHRREAREAKKAIWKPGPVRRVVVTVKTKERKEG